MGQTGAVARSLTVAALAASSVLLVACSGSSAPPQPSSSSVQGHGVAGADPTFGPSGTLGTSTDPRFGRVLASVNTLLAAVPTLPGAKRATSAPVQALAENFNYPRCAGLIDRLNYWTAPGNIGDASAYMRTHASGRLPTSLSGTATHAGVAVTFLDFGEISPAGVGSQIQVALASTAQGVAARVDAREVWDGPAGCLTQ